MPILKMRIPAEVLEAAKLAAQAFDPDTGGYDSWQPTDDHGRRLFVCEISEEYFEAFPVLKLYPDYLLDAITRDFAARFPDTQPPTLEALTAFCEAVEIDPEDFCIGCVEPATEVVENV